MSILIKIIIATIFTILPYWATDPKEMEELCKEENGN